MSEKTAYRLILASLVSATVSVGIAAVFKYKYAKLDWENARKLAEAAKEAAG